MSFYANCCESIHGSYYYVLLLKCDEFRAEPQLQLPLQSELPHRFSSEIEILSLTSQCRVPCL